MNSDNASGITHLRSRSGFQETEAQLLDALEKRGLKLLKVIDHSEDARSVGLAMPPTKLFIFGNPRVGTPVMLEFPSIAIDLPLRALIQQAVGHVVIPYNTPEYLGERHGLPESLTAALSAIRNICEEAAA